MPIMPARRPAAQVASYQPNQAALDELADVRAYDEAKRHPSDKVHFEQAMAEIEADAET